MDCGGDFPSPAKYLHLFDNRLWSNIEPFKNTCPLNFTPLPKIKKKSDVKPKKKEEKETTGRKERDGILIRNRQFSFTSFLIPICITGERKDYQLLYCICALKNALKIVSTTLRKEGFAQLYMVGMKSEVDWEKIKTNNITFSDIITEFLIKSGSVCLVAANKKEVFTKVNDRDAPFIVIFAASDIGLPCQENLCVGTSWLVFRRTEKSREVLFEREVYQCGRRALHAGILVNGCTTTIATGFKRVEGIHHFIFDNRYGDFILLQDNCYMRHSGNIIALNEGLFYKFTNSVQNWLMEKKLRQEEYHSRFTGGWLTDGYRVLRSGGLLLSPEDSESIYGRLFLTMRYKFLEVLNPYLLPTKRRFMCGDNTNLGQIKLLFIALPMAFLAEKAGGKATDGKFSIPKAVASARSIFTDLILGSINDVDSFIEVLNEGLVSETFEKNNDYTDSDDTSTDIEH